MASSKENLGNPGIFVRIFGEDDFEVLWLDGNEVIEMACREESVGGESIASYMERRHVGNFTREMYTPHGEFEGVAVLRRLTLHEAVHYLGRDAEVCAFLRPKVQARRFIEGLLNSKDDAKHQAAGEIEKYLHRFDEEPVVRLTQAAMYRMMEMQLLNITTR